LGLAVALWLVFILITRALQRSALTQIAELTNTRIEAHSVDFNIDGSVLIEKLAIRPLPVAVRGRPDQAHRYDDAILKAETVYARFGIGSLLLLRPRLKEISVNDFVFDVQYDLDTGRWNLAALKIKPPKASPGKMPLVRLERGRLQYSKVSGGRAEVAAALLLDARFGPAEEPQDGYRFNITTAERAESGKSTLTGFWQPGRITIAGGISSADVPVFERSWTINVLASELNYDQSNTYSLKLRTKDLLSTHSPSPDTSALVKPAFLKKANPFTALQRFFNRYHPAGRVDIDLEASGNLQQLAESTLRGKVYCKDVSIWDRKFPYRIEHMAGQIDLTENSAVLKNLCGRHGEAEVTFNGWSKDFGPNWRYQIQITSDNMALDDDLYNALSTRWKKRWSLFSPGGLAAINYCLARRSATDKERILAVKLLDVEAVYQKFPYPLKNLTGELFFDRESVEISQLVSQYNGRQITLNGKVTEHNTDRPIYDISIEANNIPLDSTLAASLSDRQRHLYNRVNMTGLADAEVKIFTPKENLGPASFLADVSLKEISLRIPALRGPLQKKSKTGSLKVNQFPLLVSDISAKVMVTAGSMHAKNLIADCYGGRLTGKFELKQLAEVAPEYLLQAGFDNIDLKQFLSDAKPKETSENSDTSGKMSGSLSMSGRIGDDYSRIGRCRLAISDMQVGKLSPLAKVLSVLKLTEPKDFAFERMLINSYINRNRLFFKQLDLSGKSVAFNGSGWMDLQSQNVDLILTARGQRLATAEPSVFQSLTDALGTGVVRMEVTGNVYDPQVETTTLPVIKDTLGILGAGQ
jgi:hypothetical protein